MDNESQSLREAVKNAVRRLVSAGIDEARQDAWILMAHVRGQDRVTLIADALAPLLPAEQERFQALIERRVLREPVAQIIGMKEFWSLNFEISPNVLCPRPETEGLVEAALERLAMRRQLDHPSIRILDLGTGSGCLLLTLLKECSAASGLGVDISAGALAVAKSNGERLGLASRSHWLCSHWGTALEGSFDLIVSNPPYIARRDATSLAPEVRNYEPEEALFAGEDGLDAYRLMAGDIHRLMTPDGIACLEIGFGQASDIEDILARAGLETLERRQDLAGIDRCLVLAHA